MHSLYHTLLATASLSLRGRACYSQSRTSRFRHGHHAPSARQHSCRFPWLCHPTICPLPRSLILGERTQVSPSPFPGDSSHRPRYLHRRPSSQPVARRYQPNVVVSLFPTPATPNQALQRTAPRVTPAAPPPSPAQPSRQPPPSLSLGSLGSFHELRKA